MKLLEKAIAVFSPKWAANRARYRYIEREYTAAEFNRDRAIQSARATGPVTESRRNGPTLVATARELDRNNSFAHGAFNAITANVVGAGIRLESQIKTRGGKYLARANEECESAWHDWAEGCDLTGRLSFAQLLWLVEREVWVAGESLIVKVVASDNRPVPLALEVVDSERLASLDRSNGNNQIIQGVEYTPNGTIAAYWIYPEHPSDSVTLTAPQRVAASRVIHVFHPLRPGQVRGISRVASVARNFEALGQFMDHELTRARIASAFALMIRRSGSNIAPKFPSSGATGQSYDSNGSVIDTNGNPLAHLEGGMIFAGGPNDSIESAGPNIQGSAFEQFVAVNLRAIATGLGMSYELLARDFTKTNFSSARQSSLEDARQWTPHQNVLITRCCRPVFRWFSELAFVAGVPVFQKNMSRIDTRWVVPPRPYIDPQKEMNADVLAVQNGFTTFTNIAAKFGTDAHENIRQNAQIVQEAEEAGFPLAGFTTSAAPQQSPDSTDGGQDNQDEEDITDADAED